MATDKELEQYREAAEEAMKRQKAAKQAEIERQELQDHLRKEAASAAKKEQLREDAMRIWVREGGSISEFDKQWEAMYERIIFDRTVERVRSGDRGFVVTGIPRL